MSWSGNLMNPGRTGCCGQLPLSPDELTALAGEGEHGFPSWYQTWGPDTNRGSSRVLHYLLCGLCCGAGRFPGQ